MEVALGLIIFIFGASIGSFCSAYIYRIPKGISIAKGRSVCPSCERQIKGYDLIPVLSFIVLEGKCRFCSARIPWESFVLEILCGLTAITLFQFYEMTPKSLVVFFALAVLLCVFLIDLRTMEIPNELSIALLALGVVDAFFSSDISLLDRGIGLVIISLPMFLLTLAIKNAFGGGDVKLIAAAGFLLGWPGVILATFVGLLIGGAQGVYILTVKKQGKETLFAFGPALSIGIAVALLFGDPIITWYVNLIV
jgi:leader peptidase (prepilin peptidase)/N-methyltransferase